jgi:hypothetical protein
MLEELKTQANIELKPYVSTFCLHAHEHRFVVVVHVDQRLGEIRSRMPKLTYASLH